MMDSADTRIKCPGSEPGGSGLSSQSPVGGAAARMATPVGNQAGTIKDRTVLILISILLGYTSLSD